MVVNIAINSQSEEPPASKSAANSDAHPRQPPLRLELSGLPCKRLRPLTDDHSVYGLAATLWHYGSELPPGAARALLTVLLQLWPSQPGRRGEEYTNLLAWMAQAMGASQSAIAESFLIHPRSVAKKVEAGRRSRDAVRTHVSEDGEVTFTYSIQVVTGDEARGLCGDAEILPEPLDPGEDQSITSALGVRPSWEGITPDARAAALAQLQDAIGANLAEPVFAPVDARTSR